MGGAKPTFAELPPYLAKAALFAVNTGCRDQEACNLSWEWEQPVPQLDTTVFIIPARFREEEDKGVKNRTDRLVALNGLAKEVIDVRGVHPIYVFSHCGKRLYRLMGRAWKNARKRVGLPNVRVHDLKHTFGRRL